MYEQWLSCSFLLCRQSFGYTPQTCSEPLSVVCGFCRCPWPRTHQYGRENKYPYTTDGNIVTPKSGQILDDCSWYIAHFNIVKHCLKPGVVKPSARDTVIHIKTSVGKSVFLGVLCEHFALRRDLSRAFSAKRNLFIMKNKKTVFYKSGSTDFSCFIMLFWGFVLLYKLRWGDSRIILKLSAKEINIGEVAKLSDLGNSISLQTE